MNIKQIKITMTRIKLQRWGGTTGMRLLASSPKWHLPNVGKSCLTRSLWRLSETRHGKCLGTAGLAYSVFWAWLLLRLPTPSPGHWSKRWNRKEGKQSLGVRGANLLPFPSPPSPSALSHSFLLFLFKYVLDAQTVLDVRDMKKDTHSLLLETSI